MKEQRDMLIKIVPPYNVGDKVYTIVGTKLKEWYVLKFIWYDYSNFKFVMYLATEHYEEVLLVRDFELHKTVFPTLEEAEKALAEREDK